MVLLEKTNCSLLNSLAYFGLSDSKDDAGVTGMRNYERVIWEKGAIRGGGRDEVLVRETMFSQVAMQPPLVVVSG